MGVKGALEVEAQPARVGTTGEDIRSRTYRRLDSLEDTIRELENTLMEIGAHPSSGPVSPLTPPPECPSDSAQPDPTPAEPAGSGGNKRPPVPPKPSIRPPYIQVHHPAVSHRLMLVSSPPLLTGSVPFEFSPERLD